LEGDLAIRHTNGLKPASPRSLNKPEMSDKLRNE